MNKELQSIIEKYDNEKISLSDLEYQLSIYDRNRHRIKSELLIKDIHPVLQKMLGSISEIEKKTDFIYCGIYNGLKSKSDINHYHVKFQHKRYFSISIDFSYGQAGSRGDVYYVNDDNKIHVGACDGTASFVYGEFLISDKNIVDSLLNRIIDFDKSLELY